MLLLCFLVVVVVVAFSFNQIAAKLLLFIFAVNFVDIIVVGHHSWWHICHMSLEVITERQFEQRQTAAMHCSRCKIYTFFLCHNALLVYRKWNGKFKSETETKKKKVKFIIIKVTFGQLDGNVPTVIVTTVKNILQIVLRCRIWVVVGKIVTAHYLLCLHASHPTVVGTHTRTQTHSNTPTWHLSSAVATILAAHSPPTHSLVLTHSLPHSLDTQAVGAEDSKLSNYK